MSAALPIKTPEEYEAEIARLKSLLALSETVGLSATDKATPLNETRGCPCLLAEPCGENCSCAYPFRSGGCVCCCRHGSKEQRELKAAHLKELAADATIYREALISIANHKDGNSINYREINEIIAGSMNPAEALCECPTCGAYSILPRIEATVRKEGSLAIMMGDCETCTVNQMLT